MSEPKFKVGDKVRVVGNSADHDFKVGDEIEIIKEGSWHRHSFYYRAKNNNGAKWDIYESDLSPIEEQTKERDFNCGKCGKGFNTLESLSWHKSECKPEEQTNLVAEGQSLDGDSKATLSSGVGNTEEQKGKNHEIIGYGWPDTMTSEEIKNKYMTENELKPLNRKLQTFSVQYETAEKKPFQDNGYLLVRKFRAYDEPHLREVMKNELGYYPPIYYVIETKNN